MITEIHISTVKSGDTILCPDGMVRTLNQNHIKKDFFMGTTIWGDSYNLGTIPVKIIKGTK